MTERKAPWTEGPWKVFTGTNGVFLGVGDAEAGGITDCGFGLWRDGDEKTANARLIAAAPELVEALESLAAHLEGIDRAGLLIDPAFEAYKDARDLLSRIYGEAE